MKLTKIMIIVLAILLLLLTACSNKTYVCYDGTETKNIKECPVYPKVIVTEQKVAKTADSYGAGYASGKQLQYTRVNMYLDKGDWFVDALFSDRTQGKVYETKIKIDGRTTSVTCMQGCEILGINSTFVDDSYSDVENS